MTRARLPEYGETWVYESIVGAIPGLSLSDGQAVAVQVGLFETGVLVLAWVYGLPEAVLPGTVAVAVAAAGSLLIRRVGRGIRRSDAPPAYLHLLFGSKIEVVLSVLAFTGLVTHLLVYGPRISEPSLLTRLFGPTPPVPVVYLTLLVLWDLCYRIGVSWWTAVVALWRALRVDVTGETRRRLRRADALNVAFGLVQLALVPFVLGDPVLTLAVGGHVVAVTVVSAVAAAVT